MAQTTSELADIVERFRRSLEQAGIRCRKVLLYGSQRWSTAREDSDIDLIVVSPDWASYSYLERLELLGTIAARLLEPIQAQGWTPQEIADHQVGPFWQQIIDKEAVAV
jgi:predicted nucleotidyltransferase